MSSPSGSLSILLQMLRRTKKHGLSYAGVGAMAFAASLLPVGWAEAMRRLFDAAYALDLGALGTAAIWFGAVFAAEIVIALAQAFLMQRLSNRTTLDLQRDVLSRLFVMRLAQYGKWHTGDKLQRLNQSAVSAQAGINQKLPELVQNVLSIVFLFAYLTVLTWELMAGALVVALLIPLLSNAMGKPIRNNQERTNELQAKTDAALLDQLQGAEVARSFGLREVFNASWENDVEATRRRWLRTDMLRHLTNSSVGIGFSLGQAYILGMGAWMVTQGTLGIGSIAAFILSYERIVFPLAYLTNTWAAVQDAIAHAGRVLELAGGDSEEDVPNPSGGIKPAALPAAGGDLELDNVSFRYGDQTILRGLTATFGQGRTTAVVGPSGSGKSTLLKLLLGLYPADSGSIRYGGIEHAGSDWESFRRAAAYLPQDAAILDATAADNIRIGKLDASEDEIRQAAMFANAHDFIEALPGGYGHKLGEGGSRLSGGQRQRLALARAYVRNPDILLLDEPTSALDAGAEALMQEALRSIMRDRTVIVVAHRLSTVRDADCIHYMEDGRIVESGTHEQLMSLQGRYAALVQAGEFADQTKGEMAS